MTSSENRDSLFRDQTLTDHLFRRVATGSLQHEGCRRRLQRWRAQRTLLLCIARKAGLGTGMERGPASPMNANVRAGLLAAVVALVADQASKFYLLFVYDIAARGSVEITPFFDLVLTWNRGISYGWF